MKKVFWTVVVICLLLATYHFQPQIQEKINQYWSSYIVNLVDTDKYNQQEKVDELLVLSLNFRSQNKPQLSMQALMMADSLDKSNVLIDGLKGLYYLEQGDKKKVIKSWIEGAKIVPYDPNLSYLSTLDTAELGYVDIHMLEEMFVDTVINYRLADPLYHQFDDKLISNTEKKIRIEESINNTFIISSIASIFILIYAMFSIRANLKKRRIKKTNITTHESVPLQESASDSAESKPEEPDAFDGMPKPVKYMVAISSILKIGQVFAAIFNYFMLGTDISDFVSSYVFTPANLVSLFTNNILFAIIFIIIMTVEIIRRKVATN